MGNKIKGRKGWDGIEGRSIQNRKSRMENRQVEGGQVRTKRNFKKQNNSNNNNKNACKSSLKRWEKTEKLEKGKNPEVKEELYLIPP